MKSKYMSRKFIVAIVGLVLAIIGTYYHDFVSVICGSLIAACFVIGESIVDKAASIKTERYVNINQTVTEKGEKDGISKAKA